jgi:hypothetical protein
MISFSANSASETEIVLACSGAMPFGPGWVKTEMDADDQAGDSYTDEGITDRVPMGRFALPEDIAFRSTC